MALIRRSVRLVRAAMIFATVVFPVLLYAMQIIYRILKPDDTADDPDKKKR